MTLAEPRIWLHGEGPTDLMSRKPGAGLKFCLFSLLREEAAAALAGDARGRYIADAWTEELLEAGSMAVSRGELNRPARPGKFHKGAEESDPELVRLANCAYFLGRDARAAQADLCVFFHDCDRKAREQLVRALKRGFARSGFAGAVCMTPDPTSEAWVLAALMAAEGDALRDEAAGRRWENVLRGNDKNPRSAKVMLAQRVSGRSEARELESDVYQAVLDRINAERGWRAIARLPSGAAFLADLRVVAKTLGW